jgi:hypothetical protein
VRFGTRTSAPGSLIAMPRPVILVPPPQFDTVCRAIARGDEQRVAQEWPALDMLNTDRLSPADRTRLCKLVGHHACRVVLDDLLNDRHILSREWAGAIQTILVAALMAHQGPTAQRIVRHLRQQPNRWGTLNQALYTAQMENSETALCELLSVGADPRMAPVGGISSLLGWAAQHGHARLVEDLILLGNPWEDTRHALGAAMKGPHRALWERLVVVGDPNAIALAIPRAAQEGNLAGLDFLLEARQSYPTLPLNEALRTGLKEACMAGHLPIVQRLLPMISLHGEKGACLHEALKANHLAVARALVPHSDLDDLHEQLVKTRPVQWGLLNKLIPMLEPDRARQWIKQHASAAGRLAACEAQLRAQDAQPLEPVTRLRPRRRT